MEKVNSSEMFVMFFHNATSQEIVNLIGLKALFKSQSICKNVSRDSAVGIATGYGLDD
jgi:hypothetical protein